MIVHRNDMRDTLARLLGKFTGQVPVVPEDTEDDASSADASGSVESIDLTDD